MIRICVSAPPATTKRPAAPEPAPPVNARSKVPLVPPEPAVIAPLPMTPRPIAAAMVGKMPLPYRDASRAAWAPARLAAVVTTSAAVSPAFAAELAALAAAWPALAPVASFST